jgi:hypothetical protein
MNPRYIVTQDNVSWCGTDAIFHDSHLELRKATPCWQDTEADHLDAWVFEGGVWRSRVLFYGTFSVQDTRGFEVRWRDS